MDKGESESVIIDKSSMGESKSESAHKIINSKKEKDAIDETEHD